MRRLAKHVPYELPSFWSGQLIALVCAAGGALVRFLLDPLVHGHLPVATFYPFTLAASMWGGTFSALSTTAIAIGLSDYFWLPPGGSFKLTASSAIPLVAFSIFCGCAILMLALIRALLETHVEGEERAILLSHEMKHRAGNLLDMVQAISAQTARSATSVADHQALFSARLTALAQAQQLFTESSGNLPDLRTFLQRLVEPFGAERFHIEGPAVAVPNYLGICCALLFHELATNATKHGALSVPDGFVVIEWQAQRHRVRLEWQERNGPPVTMPVRTGFGTRLLNTAFPREYGEATIFFNPDGVNCKVSFALP